MRLPRRAPTLRPRPMRLAEDPDAAFRVRAKNDRRRIAHIAGRMDGHSAWIRAKYPLAELERLAHGLAGAGGVFGFPALSAAAARLERLAERWRLEAPRSLSPRRLSLLARAANKLIAELGAVGD